MANLPLSVSINWKIIVTGLLVATGLVYYFSGYFWHSKRIPITKMLKSDYVKMNGVEKAIFYRHFAPEKPVPVKILFLHGMKFSSKTWEDIGTLQFFAKKGYEVLAVDLPGYGNSKLKAPKTSTEKAKFLHELITILHYDRPVLVVPSMSGSYAMPFIFQGENAKSLKGFVPIAPVGTEEFEDDLFKKLDLKTMSLYGQNDNLPFVSKALDKFRLIPGVENRQIDQAGHACYIDKTPEFHSQLEGFLDKLQDS